MYAGWSWLRLNRDALSSHHQDILADARREPVFNASQRRDEPPVIEPGKPRADELSPNQDVKYVPGESADGIHIFGLHYIESDSVQNHFQSGLFVAAIVADSAIQGAVELLQGGHKNDEGPAGRQGTMDEADEFLVVLDVLEHVDHDD